ncbi:MAG: hypothetical protein M1833_006434 [Piccolia ochrophora]|nr:MAG: hypothetical protein M1833_006434 [Piccolia ochrophora]
MSRKPDDDPNSDGKQQGLSKTTFEGRRRHKSGPTSFISSKGNSKVKGELRIRKFQNFEKPSHRSSDLVRKHIAVHSSTDVRPSEGSSSSPQRREGNVVAPVREGLKPLLNQWQSQYDKRWGGEKVDRTEDEFSQPFKEPGLDKDRQTWSDLEHPSHLLKRRSSGSKLHSHDRFSRTQFARPFHDISQLRFASSMSAISPTKEGPGPQSNHDGSAVFVNLSMQDPAPAFAESSTTPSILDRLRRWQRSRDDTMNCLASPTSKAIGHGRARSPTNVDGGKHEDEMSEIVESLADGGTPSGDDDGLLSLTFGDLIDIRTSMNQYDLAIVLNSTKSTVQAYTIRGELVYNPHERVKYAARGFIRGAQLEPLVPYIADMEEVLNIAHANAADTREVPRSVGAPLLKTMMKFYDDAERYLHERSAVFGSAHDSVTHEMQHKYMTVLDLAEKFFGISAIRKENLQLASYAVHLVVREDPIGFGSRVVEQYGSEQTIEVRSKQHARTLRQVAGWIQDYRVSMAEKKIGGGVGVSNLVQRAQSAATEKNLVLSRFIDKSRDRIKQSRKTRAVAGLGHNFIGPYRPGGNLHARHGKGTAFRALPSEVTFDWVEKSVIQFFEACVLNTLPLSLQALIPIVLRATGMYLEVTLNRSATVLFLQEIGVYAPWENLALNVPATQIPGRVPIEQLDDKLKPMMYSAFDLSIEEHPDSMRGLRKDWKDLDVYCIDDVTAKEIDDGVSLERIPGEQRFFWVHVHIANPTAFIPPTHPLARRAAARAETIFLPEEAIPMLPPGVTKKYFGLGKGRPTLTFSAKVRDDGTVMATDITPGIIRNVHYVTSDTVSTCIGRPARAAAEYFSVGGSLPTISTTKGRPARHCKQHKDFSEAQIDDLRVLSLWTTKRRLVRAKGSHANLSRRLPDISVFQHSAGVNYCAPSRNRSTFYEGDPIIQMRSVPFSLDKAWDADHNMVEELMVLASEIAGSWCAERRIPAPYSSTGSSALVDHYLKTRVVPFFGDIYHAPYHVAIEYAYLTIPGQMSSSPEQVYSWVPSLRYCKATSPLRRFSDMLVHWQIEAAYRHEAREGRSPGKSTDHSCLAFTDAEMEKMISSNSVRTKRLRLTAKGIERVWATRLLFRAHYFQEAQLPRSFDFIPAQLFYTTTRAPFVRGLLPLLNLDASMHVSRDFALGSTVEVELDDLDMLNGTITVKPVGSSSIKN